MITSIIIARRLLNKKMIFKFIKFSDILILENEKGVLFMYSDFYEPTTLPTSTVDSTWLTISFVIAILGGIAAYILFISKKNDNNNQFVRWLHDFLNFKTFFLDIALKVLYAITAIYITLGSFSFIRISVATFFLVLILGNIIARIAYEMLLLIVTLVNNTTEINEKMGNLPKKEKSKKKTEVENEE